MLFHQQLVEGIQSHVYLMAQNGAQCITTSEPCFQPCSHTWICWNHVPWRSAQYAGYGNPSCLLAVGPALKALLVDIVATLFAENKRLLSTIPLSLQIQPLLKPLAAIQLFPGTSLILEKMLEKRWMH